MKKFVAIVSLACLFAVPALAEEKNPTIHIQIPEQLKGVPEQYEAAVAKLTPEQKADLDTVVKAQEKTREPDIGILTRGATLEYCGNNKHIDSSYGPIFIKYRDHENKLQDEMRDAFKRDYLNKVDYMDKTLLTKNLIVSELTQLSLIAQMAKIAQNATPKEKLVKECSVLKAFLDDYIAKNAL